MRERLVVAVTVAVAAAGFATPGVDYPVYGLLLLAALSGACGAFVRALPGALATALLLASTLTAEWVPIAICAIGPYLAGRVVRSRGALVAALAERTRELEAEQAIATRLAIGHERTRIARELHDIVAHHLSVIVVQAGAGRLAADDDPSRRAGIAAAAREALVELDRLTDLLDREPPDDLGRILERARAAGLTVTAPDVALGQTARGIVREALTNVLKHAPGADVAVRVERGELEIRDGGAKAAPTLGATGSGLGLEGLRERVRAVGGTLDAGPVPGGGWSVRARLPLER